MLVSFLDYNYKRLPMQCFVQKERSVSLGKNLTKVTQSFDFKIKNTSRKKATTKITTRDQSNSSVSYR